MIYAFLSQDSYWAKNIPRETVEGHGPLPLLRRV